MSKHMNAAFCLFSIVLNHSSTDCVFLQRLTSVDVATLFTIFCSISLLIRPISDFVGLISRHVGALLKFGL